MVIWKIQFAIAWHITLGTHSQKSHAAAAAYVPVSVLFVYAHNYIWCGFLLAYSISGENSCFFIWRLTISSTANCRSKQLFQVNSQQSSLFRLYAFENWMKKIVVETFQVETAGKWYVDKIGEVLLVLLTEDLTWEVITQLEGRKSEYCDRFHGISLAKIPNPNPNWATVSDLMDHPGSIRWMFCPFPVWQLIPSMGLRL